MNRRNNRESGAAAVEFALVVPILLALIMGIVEFGFAYNYRTQLNNAAMASARHYSLHRNIGQAQDAARGVVTLPAGTPIDIVVRDPSNVVVTTGCPTIESSQKNTVTVTISAVKPAITGMFGNSFNIGARATAVCM